MMTNVAIVHSRRSGLTAHMMVEFQTNSDAKLLVREEADRQRLIRDYLIPENDHRRIITCEMILKGEVSL